MFLISSLLFLATIILVASAAGIGVLGYLGAAKLDREGDGDAAFFAIAAMVIVIILLIMAYTSWDVRSSLEATEAATSKAFGR